MGWVNRSQAMVTKECILYRCENCKVVIGWEERGIITPDECPVCGEERWEEIEVVEPEPRSKSNPTGETTYTSKTGKEMTSEEIMMDFYDDDVEVENTEDGYLVDGVEYTPKKNQDDQGSG